MAHTVAQVTLTYWIITYCLPIGTLNKLALPTSLQAAQSMAITFQSLIKHDGTSIYALLLSSFFYFQLWCIPLTWVFALLCGACMASTFEAGLYTHLLNILAVALNSHMSRQYLTRALKSSPRLQEHLALAEQ